MQRERVSEAESERARARAEAGRTDSRLPVSRQCPAARGRCTYAFEDAPPADRLEHRGARQSGKEDKKKTDSFFGVPTDFVLMAAGRPEEGRRDRPTEASQRGEGRENCPSGKLILFAVIAAPR